MVPPGAFPPPFGLPGMRRKHLSYVLKRANHLQANSPLRHSECPRQVQAALGCHHVCLALFSNSRSNSSSLTDNTSPRSPRPPIPPSLPPSIRPNTPRRRPRRPPSPPQHAKHAARLCPAPRCLPSPARRARRSPGAPSKLPRRAAVPCTTWRTRRPRGIQSQSWPRPCWTAWGAWARTRGTRWVCASAWDGTWFVFGTAAWAG